ncbi:hypothetical protein AUP68_06260 [Ilyonectria robusta]
MAFTLPYRRFSGAAGPSRDASGEQDKRDLEMLLGEYINTCLKADVRRSIIGNSDRMRSIGEGASYRVYQSKTYNPKDGEGQHHVLCAVKMLRGTPPNTDYSAYGHKAAYQVKQLEAIVRESRILCHPPLRKHGSIIDILEFGFNTQGNEDEDDEDWQLIQPFLVVEYAHQRSLSDFLASCLAKDLEIRRELAVDIAAGLEALHSCDIIHGDLKTENVLVFVHETRKFCAKLSDFSHSVLGGTAEAYVGTEKYLPPEVKSGSRTCILGQSDFVACDMWALGTALFEILNGTYFLSRDASNQFTADEVDDVWSDKGLKMQLSLLDETKGDVWMTALQATLQVDPAQRHTAKDVRRILDLDHRVDATQGAIVDDTLLSIFEIQARYVDYDLKSRFCDMLRSLGLFGPKETQSAHLIQLAQASMFGMGNNVNPAVAMHCYVFGLGTGNAEDPSGPPPELALLANYRRLVGIPAERGAYMLHTKDALRESILACEENLTQVSAERYFSARIVLYRSTTIDRLKSIKLEFRPSLPGVDDWVSLSKYVLDEGLPLNTMVEIPEQLVDLDVEPMSVVHFLCLIGDVESLQKGLPKANARQLQGLVDSVGNNLLHYACMGGSTKMALYLVHDLGLEPGAENRFGTLPLHWLVMFPNENIVEIADCLSNGLSTVDTAASGLYIPIHSLWLRGTPLHWAVSCRNQEGIRSLLRVGCSVDAEFGGYTPLAKAVELHSFDVIDILLDRIPPGRPAEMNGIGPFKRSAMHFVAGNATPMKRSIIHGGKILSKQSSAAKVARKTIERLLYYGGDINARDTNGNTPLHKAVASPFERGDENSLNVVRELIRNGADRNLQNHDGDTVLHLAVLLYWTDKPNHRTLFKMLTDEGIALMDVNPIEISLKDRNGRTPRLLSAYIGGGGEFMSLLLGMKDRETAVAELLARDNDGRGVLELVDKEPSESLLFLEQEKSRLYRIGLGVSIHGDCT